MHNMLNRPDKQDLQALAYVRQSPGFGRFDKMLEAEHAEALTQLVATNDHAAIHRLQGKVQCIAELRQLLADASTVLDRIEQRAGA